MEKQLEEVCLLDLPSIMDGVEAGLNVYAAKLLAESWPHCHASMRRLFPDGVDGRPVERCGVRMVLTAKDGTRVRVAISTETDDAPPTRGEGAL